MRFYAYLNIRDPLVAWEVAVGRLSSADILEQNKIFSLSLRQFNLFKKFSQQTSSSPQIANELRLDSLRISLSKKLPSRLRGIFLFRSIDEAKAAADRWSFLPHFRDENLSEIEIFPTKLAYLDSEWITSNLAGANDTDWMYRYWSGETYGKSPLTEVICSGVGYILNEELRRRAYEFIMQKLPKAVPLLSIATVGFNLGFSQIAQIVPYLYTNGKVAKGIHLINMRDFQEESFLYTKIKEYKEAFPPFTKPLTAVTEIQLPDFSDSWFSIDHSSLFSLLSLTFDQAVPVSSIPFIPLKSHHNEIISG